MRACESVEDRDATAIGATPAARVDGEILDPRLCPRAAQGAIEQRDALRRQELPGLLLDRDRQCAGFDDDLLGMVCACDIGGDFEQRRRRGKRRNQDGGALGDLAYVACRVAAGSGKLAAAPRQRVIAEQGESGADEIS